MAQNFEFFKLIFVLMALNSKSSNCIKFPNIIIPHLRQVYNCFQDDIMQLDGRIRRRQNWSLQMQQNISFQVCTCSSLPKWLKHHTSYIWREVLIKEMPAVHSGWSIVIFLSTAKKNGSVVEMSSWWMSIRSTHILPTQNKWVMNYAQYPALLSVQVWEGGGGKIHFLAPDKCLLSICFSRTLFNWVDYMHLRCNMEMQGYIYFLNTSIMLWFNQ
jgi:hypothetical protein